MRLTVPFESLLPSQKRVVQNPADKLLVLAGPGTGKTEVLAHRIIHLINNFGALPQEILAVTFSRKAATEMRERVAGPLGALAENIRISTLHAEALRLLHGSHGAPHFFVSDLEARLLMQDAIEDTGFANLAKVKSCQDWVRLRKAEHLRPPQITSTDSNSRMLKSIYNRYEELLTFNRSADLDSIVGKAVELLPTVLGGDNPASYIKYLLIDEYQDINECEHKLIHLLARFASKIFFVGDDDQSIYGWRGANPSIIRNYRLDFQGNTDSLEESTRCTNNILRAAVSIVSHDSGYVSKTLRSTKGDGRPVQVLHSSTETLEASWISQRIRGRVSNGEWQASKIAIICRRPDLADPVVDKLRRDGIESVYWRSGDILRDDAVQGILAFLRVTLDRADNLAVRLCFATKLGTGIGNRAYSRLRAIAEKQNLSLWGVLENSNAFPELSRWQSHFKRFVRSSEEIIASMDNLSPGAAVELVAKSLGTSSRAGAKKLKAVADRFSVESELSDFVDELHKNRSLDLAGGTAEPTDQSQNAVSVLTMHASKGLGFDAVFILGMEDRSLPSLNQEMDEQRRLLYVAMTRAKNELYLCTSQTRVGPPARGFQFYLPSRFLNEIPSEVTNQIINRQG
jgi:ATP-dependent DNA helicase UvrD/PcrA